MSAPMEVDSVSGSCSEKMKDPVKPQAKSVFDMIVVIRDLLPRVTYNKNQCKRIADRFNTTGDEEMKSMELHADSELFEILKRGQMLVQSYGEPKTEYITAREISRGDNRDEFKEFHEDLHRAWAKLGFPSLPIVKDSDLQDDAEKDKEAKLKMNQSISQSSSDEVLKKRAQVVFERTKSIAEFGEDLPSYLNIDSNVQVNDDVRVKPKKSDEFKNELPSYLAIEYDEARAGRPEWKPQSLRDAEEVGWVIVHRGKWLGCDFAIKVFKCNAAHTFNWDERELKKEAQSLVALQHPHVVRFVGFGRYEEKCLILMELMDGDLKNFMKENVGRFDKLDVINQIAKGMHYMHVRGYVHGDLKCTNILVKKLDDRVLQVKIGDLRGSQNLTNWDRDAFEKASKIRRPRWTAPEAIANYGGKDPTPEQLKRSDVYSFGMTCYEILTGKWPFHGIYEKDDGPLLKFIREGRVEEFNKLPEELDEDLKGMIRRCWCKEPSERPAFAEISLRLNSASQWNRVCEPVLSFLRSFQLLNLWRSNTSSVNSGSLGTYPHVAIIPHEHLKRSPTVEGTGSAGEVFKATWLNCTVAVKKLYPKGEGSPPFPCEVTYLIEVSHHPCTVQMIGLSENPEGEFEIVMEYMKMNLRELIYQKKAEGGAKGGPFNFEKALLIITKIALGMVYLHSRGLVHRDLKPENVLVRDYNDTIDVKIADFGESHLKTIAGIGSGYFDGVGSPLYRAPEVFPLVRGLAIERSNSPNVPAKRIVLERDEAKRNLPKSEEANTVKAEFKKAKLQKESAIEGVKLLNDSARLIIEKLSDEADLDAIKATDVYSFGMVCYMVLTAQVPYYSVGQDPYSDLESNYFKVWNGLASLEWPSDSHSRLRSLVERCVRLDPAERPTFEKICQELHEICREFHNTSGPKH